MKAKATSFATLKDLRNYIRCLVRGGSETHCYNYGDNGTGAWGDNTAQLDIPMVALPPAEMAKRWGTSKAARGKKVRVVLAGAQTAKRGQVRTPYKIAKGRRKATVYAATRPFTAQVGDKGPAGVIDLNPAALVAAGLPSDAELSTTATWEWI